MASAYQGDKPYVFLSYSHKDEELALSVIEYLQEHSFNVWYDEGIHTATQWKDVIINKIANCWIMVFLVTQNSLASKECRREIVFADKKEKKFLNVVIGSPQFPDWFICDFDEYQRLDEEKFPNRKAMLDRLNTELIWHQRNTDKPTDTAKETPKETSKAKAPWVCKNCGSNNSGDDDVCEVCGSSDRYVAPKETPKLSPTEGLEFSIVDGTARVDRYKGTDTKVIIPATIIRDGKTYKVTSIKNFAFKGCENITSINIPDGVTSIGKSAFCECTNLTSVTIPDSITTIGRGSFAVCTSLTSISVDENNQNYKSIDGNLYSKDGTTLIKYAIGKTNTSFTIPESVTSIGESAFCECTNLTSISIPNSITTIGDFAFLWCENLTSITIPDSVTSIGESAFWWCKNLTSITIPDSVTSISESAFEGCKKLTSITIPESVTSIGKSAFEGCENLTSITIPNSVTTIDWGAFAWCENLTSITIPDGVTTIGAEAFASCSSLTSIIIPSSVTFIGESAFHSCTNLTSITIPGSVTSIGYKAFGGCKKLTSITIPDGVTSIEDFAFSGCENLTIYCEAKSKPEGWDTYWNPHNRPVVWGYGSSSPKEDEVCGSSKHSTDSTTTPKPSPTESLEFIVINDTTTIVSDYTGTDTEVIIPAAIIRDGKTYKVTSIGYWAFRGCENLTSITIPKSITSIGKEAFHSCTNLTSISIPKGVAFIGYGAFQGCEKLTIYCEAKSRPYKWSALWNSSDCAVIWGHKIK